MGLLIAAIAASVSWGADEIANYANGPSRRATSSRAALLYWPREADQRGGCGVQKRRCWADEPLVGTMSNHVVQVHRLCEVVLGGCSEGWNRRYWRDNWSTDWSVVAEGGRAHCALESAFVHLSGNSIIGGVKVRPHCFLATSCAASCLAGILAHGSTLFIYRLESIPYVTIGRRARVGSWAEVGAHHDGISISSIVRSARWVGGGRAPLAKKRAHDKQYRVFPGLAPHGKGEVIFVMHASVAEKIILGGAAAGCSSHTQASTVTSMPGRLANCGKFRHHHKRSKGQDRDVKDRVEGPTTDRGRIYGHDGRGLHFSPVRGSPPIPVVTRGTPVVRAPRMRRWTKMTTLLRREGGRKSPLGSHCVARSTRRRTAMGVDFPTTRS